MSRDLFLHQEIMLLSLSDQKGTASGMYIYALAGAMLTELFFYERLVANDDKKQTVAVVNAEPIGEPLLDEFLAMIVESKKHLGTKDWVFKAAKIKKLHHRIAQSLCAKGILKNDERKILFLFTRQVYPEVEGTFEDEIRNRMAKVMFDNNAKPDPGTAVLIALSAHTDLLRQNFAPVELKQHKKRIKELAKCEIMASGATKAAVEAVQAAVMVATMAAAASASS